MLQYLVDCKYHYVRRIFVFGQRDKSKVQNTQRQKKTKRQKGKYFWTSPKRQKYRKIKDTKTKHKKVNHKKTTY